MMRVRFVSSVVAVGVVWLTGLVLAPPGRAAWFPVPAGCVGGSGCAQAADSFDAVPHVVVSPSSPYAFGVVGGGGALLTFQRAADGTLAAASCVGNAGGCSPVPLPAALEDARELALSPDGQELYVIAEGDHGTALSQFRVGADGSLAFSDCVGSVAGCRAPGAAGAYDNGSDVAVSPDGRDVYVLADGRIVQFRHDASGALTVAGCAGGPGCAGAYADGTYPQGLAVSPDGTAVYATDGYPEAFWPGKVEHFHRAADGSLSYADCTGVDVPSYDTPCTPLPAGVASLTGPHAIVVSPGGRDVYVSGEGGDLDEFSGFGAITHLRVQDDGSLRFADCVGEGPAGCPQLPAGTTALRYPRSLAIHPDGRDLYTSAIVDGELSHLTLGPDGALTFASCVGTSPSPACSFAPFAGIDDQQVTVSPDGADVYAPGGASVWTFALRAQAPAATGTPPTVQLEDPASVGQLRAQLRARVTGAAGPWTERFEYGPTTAYGAFAGGGSRSSTSDGTVIDTSVGGLAGGTTYHYRLVVLSAAGVAHSADGTFTTAPYQPQGPPDVETLGALGNAGTGVALAATVDPGGGPATYHFDWGQDGALDHQTPERQLPADSATHSLTQLLDGLTPGVAYSFRITATNAYGTAHGLTRSVTAATPPPAPAEPATTTIAIPATVAPATPLSAGTPTALRPGTTPATTALTSLALSRTRIRAGRPLVLRYRDIGSRAVVVRFARLRAGRLTPLPGGLRHHDRAGVNTIRWNGRLRGHALAPGRYVITVRPAAGGPALDHRLTVLRR